MSSREGAVLAAARRGFSPTAEDQARVRLATFLAIDAASTAAVGDAGPAALGASSSFASDAMTFVRRGARFVAMGAIVAAATATGYGFGWRAGSKDSSAVQTDSAPRTQPAPAVPPLPAEVHVERALGASNDNVAPSISEHARDPRVSRSTRGESRPSVKRPVEAAPSPEPEDVSGQELRTLRRVEQLLRGRNAAYAQVLLRELDREVPHGRFMEERAAAGAVAACELEPDAKRTRAVAFAKRYPSSMYQKRVDASCATGSAAASDDGRGGE